VLHGVVEEVEQQVAERLRPHGERRPRVDLRHDARPPRRREGTKFLDYPLDLLSDSLRDGGRRVDVAETREAEDILDEMVQPRRLSIDMAERPIAFGVGLRAAEAEGLEIELDLGER